MIHAQTMRCASLSRSMASKSRLNKKWDSRYLEPRIVSVEPGQSHENSKGSENAMVELQQPENVASLLSSPGILLHSLSFLGPFLLRGFLDEEFQPDIQQKSSHSRRDRLHWTIRNSHTHTLCTWCFSRILEWFWTLQMLQTIMQHYKSKCGDPNANLTVRSRISCGHLEPIGNFALIPVVPHKAVAEVSKIGNL